MTSDSRPSSGMKTASANAHRHDRAIALVVMTAATLLHALHPGDARWIHDEPALIGLAEEYNAEGRPAPYGLEGTRGARYGPLPLWIYQACLASGLDDLPTLVLLRAVAMTVATGSALLVIGRAAGMAAWPMMLALVSPWFWVFARTLWDNTLLIPLAGWAVAGYAMFLGGSMRGIVVAAACSGAMILTHLMCLPLVAALTLHAVVARPRHVLAARWPLAGVAAAIAAAGVGYWPVLAADLMARESRPLAVGQAVRFLLNAGDWFHGLAFGDVVGADWLRECPKAWRALLAVMGIATGCVVGALVYACVRVWHTLRSQSPWSTRDHLVALSLVVLALALPFHAVLGAVGAVHYYNAMWIAYAVMIGLGADALLQVLGLRTALVIVLLMAAMSTLSIAVRIHETSGTRTLAYGPTLANQQALARSIAALPDGSTVVTDISDLAETNLRIMVLVRRERPDIVPRNGPATTGFVTYATARSWEGGIWLEDGSGRTPYDPATPIFPLLGAAP
jgi:hypothetical protein